MSEFDYANARLRAMKARLLREEDYRDLAHIPTLETFLGALRDSPYRASLEAAVARPGSLQAIYRVLQSDLRDTIAKASDFFEGGAAELVQLATRELDINNLKAIVRGLSRGVPAMAIAPALTPTPSIPYSILMEISRAAGLREAVDRMSSLGLDAASPLLSLEAPSEGRLSELMEWELTRWHYEDALERAQLHGRQGRALREALKLEVDAINLTHLVRKAQARSLREGEPVDRAAGEFLQGGSVQRSKWEQAEGARSPTEALREIAGTRIGRRLTEEIDLEADFEAADVERALWRIRVSSLKRQMVTDPLGIGVFSAYLALKRTELINLRWIAASIRSGLAPDRVMARVELLL